MDVNFPQFILAYDAMTDLQKEEFIAQSIGKWVDWNGNVEEVATNSTVTIKIPGNEDWRIILKEVPRETAITLEKDKYIHFVGHIKSISDFFGMRIYLDQVTIKQ